MLQWRPFNEIPELMKKKQQQSPLPVAMTRPNTMEEDDASSASSVASCSPPLEEALEISGNYFASTHNTLPRLYGMEYTFKEMAEQSPPEQSAPQFPSFPSPYYYFTA